MQLKTYVACLALGAVALVAGTGYPRVGLVFGPSLANRAEFDLNGRRWTVQNATRPWSTRIIVNRASMVAFEVREGDYIGAMRQNNRSEVLLARNQPDQIIPYDIDFWAAGAVAIQGDYSANNISVIIAQVHDTPNAGTTKSRSPAFALRLVGDGLNVTALGARNPHIVGGPLLVRIPAVRRSAFGAPLVFHHWVARLRFSRGVEGEVDFWWDGRLVFSGKGLAMGYNNHLGGYWKHGLYRSTAAPGRLRVIHANVEIGTESLRERVAHPLPLR